jgi:hypothetical protein
MRRVLSALAVAVFVAACAGIDQRPSTPSPSADAAPSQAPPVGTPGVAPPGPGSVQGFQLNEVRVAPVPGAPAFVELRNGSTERASPAGLSLAGGTTYALPSDAPEVEPGGLVVITFDDGRSTVGNEVHAPISAFPASDGGSLRLLDGTSESDRVTWGDGSLAPGGLIDDPAPGSVAARVPAGGAAGTPWALLGRSAATPGTPNPVPTVTAFATPDGSVFQDAARLAWYGVPGATSYRVELSTDGSFGTLLEDSTIVAARPDALTSEQVSVDGLAPGLYFWRVTAIFPSGVTSVSDARRVGVRAAPSADLARGVMAAPIAEAVVAPSPPTNPLAVPHLKQRKDTAMLQLENPSEDGPLAWDRPDEDRPTRPYCVYAAVAMLNRFYSGDWSVDYAHYVTFRDQAAGPELDLQERGARPPEWRKTIQEALGVDPGPATVIADRADLQTFYSTVRAQIDAGRPLAAIWPGHAVLVVGYAEQDEFGNFSIMVQDGNGRAWARSEFAETSHIWLGYFTIPPGARGARQPPGVTRDGDGDGVVDFDETARFGLDSGRRDSDRDELPDKQDIRAGTWDERHGYARGGRGRDVDGDRTPMERDPDADGGGCFDGMEDEDRDGVYEAGAELDNFERGDDPCVGGTYLLVLDQTTPFETTRTLTHVIQKSSAAISLVPQADGTLEGRAIVSYFIEGLSTSDDPDLCARIDIPRVSLIGESRLTTELSDGKLVVYADPEAGPPISTTAVGCGISQTSHLGDAIWFAGWGLIEFANGRYDYRQDYPIQPPATGEFYVEVHLREPGL